LPAVPAAHQLVDFIDRRGWVTWERSHGDAQVLMVTNAWPRSDRPVHGVFLERTVDGLAAQGLEADVLFIRGYRGVHCYLLGCLMLAIMPFARPGKYRLVHSHAGETAPAARFFHGAPVIASYWGSDILGPPQQGLRARLKSFLRSRVLRAHALSLTATTTKSAEMERCLPRRARRRNWVIPDGVDRTQFRPMDRREARRLVGWPADELTAISVGQPYPLKRLWLAEQAAGVAAGQLERLRWRAISDVAPDRMPAHYNAADCLLHTSVSEGSPNAVKEALACNLPVVATASGDIEELLADVRPSAVCDGEPEALARGIVSCVREGTRSNGRELSARLGIEETTARTLEFYASLGVSTAGARPIAEPA
jgi:glycosyltransferase involved in cell wall biosynthesis